MPPCGQLTWDSATCSGTAEDIESWRAADLYNRRAHRNLCNEVVVRATGVAAPSLRRGHTGQPAAVQKHTASAVRSWRKADETLSAP